jgi:hypothetical protein
VTKRHIFCSHYLIIFNFYATQILNKTTILLTQNLKGLKEIYQFEVKQTKKKNKKFCIDEVYRVSGHYTRYEKEKHYKERS